MKFLSITALTTIIFSSQALTINHEKERESLLSGSAIAPISYPA